MAVPSETVQTYAQVGIREDLSDVISNIDPYATPWYSSIKKTKASNTYHEWLTDTLDAPSASNAAVEGDDTTANAYTAPARLGNYTQILKKGVTVSGTGDAVNTAGRSKEMAYQVAKRLKEIKTDVEMSMFANNARAAGNASTAREMAGLGAWITTNTANLGTAGSDPTGDGTNARSDGSDQSALTQTDFDTVMQGIWEEGGNPDMVFLSAANLQVAINTFTGMNNQRSYLEASKTGKNSVVNALDVYVTPWGKVQMMPSRHVRSIDVAILDTSKWEFANLRPVTNKPLAKTGDAEKRQIVMEGTLVCRNEKANGLVADVG